MTARNTGFTLIELSIVLVIIGLITGGVLVGKDLIRAAEIRKFYSEKEHIVLAVNTFRSKYNCIPGDCSKATDFFGTDPEGCWGVYDKTPKTETCNGNGDTMVRIGYLGSPYAEEVLIWQHLASAGLISGIYSGGRSTGYDFSPSNIPAISLRPDSMMVVLADYNPSSGLSYLVMSGEMTNHIGWITKFNGAPSKLFTPAEMFAFDQKYDDGRPGGGKIMPVADVDEDCTIPRMGPAPNATYNFAYTEKNCAPLFNNLF